MITKNKSSFINIPVVPEVKQELIKHAKAEGLSLSAFTRRAIMDGVLWRLGLMVTESAVAGVPESPKEVVPE